MRVIVPVLEYNEPAHLVLTAEGVSHEQHIVKGEHGYASLLDKIWHEGKGFIVVERDIAPWPGAIRQLSRCNRDWCLFRYMEGGLLTRGLGCVKFSNRLVQEAPNLSHSWKETSWRILDGVIGYAIVEEFNIMPCYHNPSVAHVRGLDN